MIGLMMSIKLGEIIITKCFFGIKLSEKYYSIASFNPIEVIMSSVNASQ